MKQIENEYLSFEHIIKAHSDSEENSFVKFFSSYCNLTKGLV